jgi:hypothetical protein
MASGTSDTSGSSSSDTTNDTTTNNTASTDSSNSGNTQTTAANGYKISQINQVMLNKETLDKAYSTINTALQQMTLDPYAADPANTDNMNQAMGDNGQTASGDSQSGTTVNIYNGDSSSQQSLQMSNMGQTYDPEKMQQLHSGLYKVSVGMQLLKQLQDNIAAQIEQSSVDTSAETQFYVNQYYNAIQDRNKLDSALTYINEAVDLININPYVDANGLVYDKEKMTQLHDSIYSIAQGVVDLNKLKDDLLTQAVKIGALAQDAYNKSLNNTSDMSNMNMSGTGISTSTIITFVLITFVVIFILALLGSIMKLFKSGNNNNVRPVDQNINI